MSENYPAPLANANGQPSEAETLALLRSPSDLMRSPMTKRLMTKKLMKKRHSGAASPRNADGSRAVPIAGESGFMHPMSPSDSNLSPCSRRLRKPKDGGSKGGKEGGVASKLKSSLLCQQEVQEEQPPTPKPSSVFIASTNPHKCEVALNSTLFGDHIKVLSTPAHFGSASCDSDDDPKEPSPHHPQPPLADNDAPAATGSSSSTRSSSSSSSGTKKDGDVARGAEQGRSGAAGGATSPNAAGVEGAGSEIADTATRAELANMWSEHASVSPIELSMLAGEIAREKLDAALVAYADRLSELAGVHEDFDGDGTSGDVAVLATCTIAARVLPDRTHVHPGPVQEHGISKSSKTSPRPSQSGSRVPAAPAPDGGGSQTAATTAGTEEVENTNARGESRDLQLLPIVDGAEDGRVLLRLICGSTIVLYTVVACIGLPAKRRRSELAVTELAVGTLTDEAIEHIISNATEVQQAEKEAAHAGGLKGGSLPRTRQRAGSQNSISISSRSRGGSGCSQDIQRRDSDGESDHPFLARLSVARRCLGRDRLFTAACALPVDDDEFMAAAAVVSGANEGVHGLPLDETSAAVSGVTGEAAAVETATA